MASVTHYDLVLSPRPEDLVVITPTPSNVLKYLVPRGKPVGLPGLHLEEARADAFQLRHLVTGARMTVTDRYPAPPFDGDFDERRVWTVDQGLTGEEHDALADVLPMTDDTLVLLSGLMSRIGLCDPQRQWALGNWFMDPLDRTDVCGGRVGRRLWGRGGWWELTWGGFPFAEDVAMALTDPPAGIAGAAAVRGRRGWEVRVGTAVLALRVEAG
ncbi:hypothetical protein ACIRPU_43740 [Streptomyces sp. NPDC102259]|uniref:hypothetical protein n=1 Tax=Streptomyces sp. NPDC102259 TaxID=3366148 RepID=UPI00380081E9